MVHKQGTHLRIRAKEAKLVQELFNERDVVTFRDLWLTTGEILWENVIGPLIPI